MHKEWVSELRRLPTGEIDSFSLSIGGSVIRFTPEGISTAICGGGVESSQADPTRPEGRRLSGQQALVNLTAIFLGWCKDYHGVIPTGWTADDVKSIGELSQEGSRRCHLDLLTEDCFRIYWFGFWFMSDDGVVIKSQLGAEDPIQGWADTGKLILEYHAQQNVGIVPMLAE